MKSRNQPDLSDPALSQALPPAKLIRLLTAAAENKFPVVDGQKRKGTQQVMYRQHMLAVEQFAEFLKGKRSVNPDEQLLEDFRSFLIGGENPKARTVRYYGEIIQRLAMFSGRWFDTGFLLPVCDLHVGHLAHDCRSPFP